MKATRSSISRSDRPRLPSLATLAGRAFRNGGLEKERDGLERVKGIEPSYAAWEAAVLPLNYTRIFSEADAEGASWSWSMRCLRPANGRDARARI